MKLIDVSTPKHPNTFAQVDDDDFQDLSRYCWYAFSHRKTIYAIRSYQVNGKWCKEKMHRRILRALPGQLVDHKDGNGLNNQRENIRIATSSDNNRNRRVFGSARVYRGVRKVGARWVAEIKVNNRTKYLGRFPTPELAASAYNEAAIRAQGEFAILNAQRSMP